MAAAVLLLVCGSPAALAKGGPPGGAPPGLAKHAAAPAAAKHAVWSGRATKHAARTGRGGHARAAVRSGAPPHGHVAPSSAAPMNSNGAGGSGTAVHGHSAGSSGARARGYGAGGRAARPGRARASRSTPAGVHRRAARRAASARPGSRPTAVASSLALARHRALSHRRALRRRAARHRALQVPGGRSPVAAVASRIPAAVSVAAAAPAAHKPRAAARGTRSARPRSHHRASSGPVTVITRTVRDIAHVIPGWAKALIAALAALLAVAALIIVGTALRNRHLRGLSRRLLDEVGTLSAALLPVIPAHVGMLGLSVAYRPAEGLAAGGDFYDVFPLDHGRVGIVVGDVSGHGRGALGPATFIRHMVRSYLEAGLVPRAALQLAGEVLDGHSGDEFATVVAAVHDPSAGTLSYAAAGHPPPIIEGTGAHAPLTIASSPPIGVDHITGLRQTTVPVAPGSTIWFFTDGLLEARVGSDTIGRSRLEQIVRELPPRATAEQLVARVARETDALPDDVAVCMVRVEGGAPSSSTLRVEEIEVTRPELRSARLRSFLEACGIAPDEVDAVLHPARPRAAKYGSIVLRVRLADDRSGVDILPVERRTPVAELASLRRTS